MAYSDDCWYRHVLVRGSWANGRRIKLDETTSHITLQKHPWRPLETASSQRDTPLIGSALRVAERIVDQGNRFAFPRYCSELKYKANSANAALNKWLERRLPVRCVIHSFRHSLRDRLRAVKCPSEIIDAIGGWTTAGIGHKYGRGHYLDTLWLQLVQTINVVVCCHEP